LASRHGEARAKGAHAGNQESVQRFRTLMHGKPSSKGYAGNNAPDEDALVDIERGASADADENAGASADANELPPDQEQALRDLLQRQLGEGAAQLPVLARSGDDNSDDQHDDRRDNDQAAAANGMQVLHATQSAMQPNPEQAMASQASMAPALAELIERHVKQLLVPDVASRSAAQAREIMITLKDGLLPGTELWLSRTGSGWKLRADTRSSTAYRSLIEGAPQLIERFAQSRLGELEVTPTLLD
jgi:hypothetical protein